MSSGETRARAMLDAWRERGDDHLDPIRFHFIEALERRAAAHEGEARRILDERLSGLIEAYAHALLSAASSAADGSGAGSTSEPARGPLAALVDYIASRAPADGEGAAAGSAAPNPRADAKLEALDYFRQTWSKVNAERQLRQSLAQVPGNAGPLNSSSLVHRSLSLMRELSPGYLQQFLSYVDALSHLEQMSGAGAMTGKDAPRAAGARKRARGKAR